jgi:Tat protein secretion system quality control protein TatD with DNase activity
MIIGIGEIGTDLYREPYHEFYEEQKKAFHDQCILAKKYNLPIIIHSRNDFAGSIEVLRSVIPSEMERSGMKSRDLDNGAQNQPFKIYFHCR